MAARISSAAGMGTGLPAREPMGVALPGDPGVDLGFRVTVLVERRFSVSVSLPEPGKRGD